MTSSSVSSSSKPILSLSVSSDSNAPISSNTATVGRITSWGSAHSDTGSMNSFYQDQHMTPLPSPMANKDWNPLGASTNGMASYEHRDSWLANSLARNSSLRRVGRTSSVFEEFREEPAAVENGAAALSNTEAGFYDWAGTSTSGKSTSRANSSDSGVAPTNEAETGLSPPSRSKTLDFFGSDSSSALSPPPNPLSRGGSLNRGTTNSAQPAGGSNLSRAASTGSSWLDRVDKSLSKSIGTTASRPTTPDRIHGNGLPTSPTKPLLQSLQTTRLRASSIEGGIQPPDSRPLSSLPSAVDTPNSVGTPPAPSSGSRGAKFLSHSLPAGSSQSRRPLHDLMAAQTDALSPISSASENSARPVASPKKAESSLDSEEEVSAPIPGEFIGNYQIEKLLGKGAFSRVTLAKFKGKGKQVDAAQDENPRLFALKLILRKTFEGNDRMKISVVREVQVLKNIQHPSLVSLSACFNTRLYSVLVLDFAQGGELFDFLADWHQNLTEPLARRIFGELSSAVGWMHKIGLVHRDIKLENILLTCRPFPSLDPNKILTALPSPFVKLTDFGLSRFINPVSPILTTRCGSEAYASAELIMGKPYDGRKTDAWALGVVLYAIITGVLPFVEDVARGRKSFLLKIAKGEYKWPIKQNQAPTPSNGTITTDPTRLVTPAVQNVVARLLVRDPAKRAKVDEIWEMEWMQGEGRPEPVSGIVLPRDKESTADVLSEAWSREEEGFGTNGKM